VPGVVGGSEEYATRLLAGVAEQVGRSFDVTVFVNRSMGRHHRDVLERFTVVRAPVGGRPKGVRILAEATWLAAQTRARRIDLVHHLGGTVPPGARHWGAATVLTVHDLQPLALPEHFHPLKRAYLGLALPRSVRAADRIVTLSAHARDDLVARLGVRAGDITLVPAGVRPRDLTPTGRDEEVLARHGVAGAPYFLYPAITYPHKNHLLLLEAFGALRARHPEARLVLTGGAAGAEEAVRERVWSMGQPSAVIRPGRVPAEDLDVLYRRATALTFPSTFEGFGLPVLEAMVRGCPVLASSNTSLPEVVGGAGILLAPDRPGDWTEAMATMIERPQRRAELVEAGRARARDFAWDRSAARLLAVWREVLGERGAA
jgi:alpha-1,3-rhamnosyl/mannosyltransferase